jgi:signal transduction histidine kinase
VRHFIDTWYPVRVEGESVGIGAIVRDVTGEREAEEFQRHVLGIVGHDLRSPLAAVATAAQLLRRGGTLGERQVRLVENIIRGAERIERVIGMLLDYARAQSGGVPVTPGACDVAAICRSVAQECEAAHPGASVRFVDEGDSCGEWDADRLGQVLQNLVSNALDHSAPGAAVDLSCRGGEDHVEVAVENRGPPIASELLPRLFEPFQRGARGLQRPRNSGGLGLGLFIARAIVAAHGGNIDVSSNDDRTVFTVHLPRRIPSK